jgi:hypothetical protein
LWLKRFNRYKILDLRNDSTISIGACLITPTYNSLNFIGASLWICPNSINQLLTVKYGLLVLSIIGIIIISILKLVTSFFRFSFKRDLITSVLILLFLLIFGLIIKDNLMYGLYISLALIVLEIFLLIMKYCWCV